MYACQTNTINDINSTCTRDISDQNATIIICAVLCAHVHQKKIWAGTALTFHEVITKVQPRAFTYHSQHILSLVYLIRLSRDLHGTLPKTWLYFNLSSCNIRNPTKIDNNRRHHKNVKHEYHTIPSWPRLRQSLQICWACHPSNAPAREGHARPSLTVGLALNHRTSNGESILSSCLWSWLAKMGGFQLDDHGPEDGIISLSLISVHMTDM